MRCPSCTSEVPDTSRFCSSCGLAISSSEMATMAEMSGAPAKADSKPPVSAGGSSPGGARRSTLTSQSIGRFAPGTIFAERYRIIGLLGKGGMGEVYRADDLTLDQPVALKFLPEKLAADPGRLERFYAEVRVARQVSHPNVCRIYDIGQVEGQHFISMEYIDGEDLASLLRRIGRLPNDKALEIARQMCAGLAAAHEKRVLHRDLKPANIMIDGQGKVRIADFGLARVAEDLQDAKAIEGTPAYMAPEQFAGKGESAKSDLYSLGLVLYEMFTGKAAFKAATVSELVRLHRETNPTNPSTLIAEMDPIVERVILRCLEKDPAQRPVSALAVSAALPGADPLAAALAAGETPSPEMVAAAGDEGALRPLLAWAGLGYILVALAIITILSGKTSILSWIPQPKEPDVLAERGRELIKKLGYVQEPRDQAYGYEQTDFVGQLSKAANRAELLKLGEPPAIFFWYRQGQEYLTNESFYSDGAVGPTRPPQEQPNMIGILLGPDGRLLQLNAVPPKTGDASGEPPKVDWNVLFSEAGLDLEKFKPVSPTLNPSTYADTRMAWEGTYPRRADISIHIEAAALQGKPVYFQIFQPWNRPSRAETRHEGAAEKVVSVVILLALLGVVAGAFLLAWRNLRSNKGDRRGAWRISFFLFVLEALGRLLQAHFVRDLGETIGLSWLIVSRALMFGTFIWVGYIALEPHIRRLWPHTIISWSRLLVGHLRDPRIGRDFLIGGAFGITIPLLDQVTYLAGTKLGFSTSPALASADSINSLALGVRSFIGLLATQLTSAVSAAMYMFLFLFLLRLILRKEWLAIALFIAALTVDTARGGENLFAKVFLGLVLSTSIAFLLRKFGLFAVVASIVFLNIPEVFPITANMSLWYSNASIFTLLFLSGLAIYAFRISLAGKRTFAFDLLKE